MNMLDGLNDEQKEAVLHTEGPLLILAGAGSGKTRVLTHRIAHLVKDKKVYPSNILAITFTNKAAREMKDRIEKIVSSGYESIWVGTFHSICMRILRRDIEKLGYDKNFVVFDSSNQKTLVNECLKELNIDDKKFPYISVLDEIGKAKDNLESPDTYTKRNQNDFRLAIIAKVYALYQKKLFKNNALDFDDIIINVVKLLSSNSELLEYYQNKFKYVHVDEYQDTNNAQYKLVSLFSGGYKNLCVVGDDDQSIYGWRGANIENILNFEKHYTNCKVIKLEQNYRSTSVILDAANHVIANNTGRKSKKLWTSNEKGENIVRYFSETEYKEAYFVASEINKLRRENDLSYNNFAVLYRTNAQSRVMEDVFMKEGLPYRIVGGLKFYDRKEIKDLIAYLRILSNPSDYFSLKRIINSPKRGIGSVTIEAAETISNVRGISLFSVISSATEIPELKRASQKLYLFSLLINKMRSMKNSLGLTEYVSMVLDESGLLKDLEDNSKDENISRIENLQEFKSVAKEFESQNPNFHLEEFLEHISLVTDLDTVEEGSENILMMTMHSAKGLEFPIVFIVGSEDGVFPSSRSFYEESDAEEERRLCYVGITRARERLYFTHAYSRTLYGNTTYNKISRFVSEIPESLIDYIDGRFLSSKDSFTFGQPKSDSTFNPTSLNPANINMSSFGNTSHSSKNFGFMSAPCSSPTQTCFNISNIKSGTKVKHKKFGDGIITGIEPENGDYKLDIKFDSSGMKRLMASFANLVIME